MFFYLLFGKARGELKKRKIPKQKSRFKYNIEASQKKFSCPRPDGSRGQEAPPASRLR
jgi:hypothetical protein